MSRLNRLIDRMIERIPQGAWWMLSFLMAVLILYIGTRPGDDLGAVSRLPPGMDKVLHFTGYAVLATCVFRAAYPLSARRPPSFSGAWLSVFAIPMIVGVIDESLQARTPGRASDLRDWIADAAAGVVVCAVAVAWRSHARSNASKRND